MLHALLLSGLALLAAPAAATDTTFAVPADARIEIENFNGSVEVRTWDRDAVSVKASHSERESVRVRMTGSLVRIDATARFGPTRNIEYVVTVPAKAALRISGPFSDVTVNGAGGDVVVETVRGDVHVRGGSGVIDLRSVEGLVTLEGGRGRISLGAVNEGIRVANVIGELLLETVNGDVEAAGVQSDRVEASTVNGDIRYDGTFGERGFYSFATHNGDLSIGVPENVHATFSVATFNGDLDSYLPIALNEIRPGKRFSFAMGEGSARVELESFNGTIRLRRPAGH